MSSHLELLWEIDINMSGLQAIRDHPYSCNESGTQVNHLSAVQRRLKTLKKCVSFCHNERERDDGRTGGRESKTREHVVKARERLFGHVWLIGLSGAANGFRFMSKLH